LISPPPIVSPTCEAHTKSTASKRQIIAQAKGHWEIATWPKCRAGITAGVNDAVMVAFVMVSLAGSASLVALPPVRDLLLRAKHLFVAATFATTELLGICCE
jgi:hypothetical protein